MELVVEAPVRILVVNAGSSSLKLRLIGATNETLMATDLPAVRAGFDPDSVESAVTRVADRVDAVGHRVVHGGAHFSGPVRVTGEVVDVLRALAVLAPLHQPAAIHGIETVGRLLPGVPAVASFDTAFHRTLPDAAATYAVPLDWRQRLGVRRYGFHGLSHAYATRRAAEVIGRPPEELRIVTCHLGAGASLAAVAGGRSVDTTMGFTPLEGLVMATRAGTVDPGLVPWLVQQAGLDVDEVGRILEQGSGLLALAGTADMAAIERSVRDGEAPSKLAFDVYVHRLRAGIAAMAAALGGIDAITFTGGVGENSPTVRAEVAIGLRFLGIAVDERANREAVLDADVSATDAAVRTLVLRSREDVQIADEVRATLR